jgi:hypothetical protein
MSSMGKDGGRSSLRQQWLECDRARREAINAYRLAAEADASRYGPRHPTETEQSLIDAAESAAIHAWTAYMTLVRGRPRHHEDYADHRDRGRESAVPTRRLPRQAVALRG